MAGVPVIDPADSVWNTLFIHQEVSELAALVKELRKPMLRLGAAVPQDVS